MTQHDHLPQFLQWVLLGVQMPPLWHPAWAAQGWPTSAAYQPPLTFKYIYIFLVPERGSCSSQRRGRETKQPNQQNKAEDCRLMGIRYVLLILLDKH